MLSSIDREIIAGELVQSMFDRVPELRDRVDEDIAVIIFRLGFYNGIAIGRTEGRNDTRTTG